jgi:hypothetical protein
MALYKETSYDDWARRQRQSLQNSAQNLQQKQAGLQAAQNQKQKTTLESALSGLIGGLKERGSDILNTANNIGKTVVGAVGDTAQKIGLKSAQKDDSKRRNEIAKKYGYNKLEFLVGDISKFKDDSSFDMIVTLHACDTATDYALYHAINLKCKYIFSVPCCQHEVNQTIDKDSCRVINKFGILKERYSAIVTDAIRANILQYCGYKTQVMEFIDIDNSPKNLLIRAIYQGGTPNEKIKDDVEGLIKSLGINQTLYNLVFKG